MTVHDRTNVPDSVGCGILDPELETYLPHGPTLGSDVTIAQGRNQQKKFVEGPWPEIGLVEELLLDGPHGSMLADVGDRRTEAINGDRMNNVAYSRIQTKEGN